MSSHAVSNARRRMPVRPGHQPRQRSCETRAYRGQGGSTGFSFIRQTSENACFFRRFRCFQQAEKSPRHQVAWSIGGVGIATGGLAVGIPFLVVLAVLVLLGALIGSRIGVESDKAPR